MKLEKDMDRGRLYYPMETDIMETTSADSDMAGYV